MSSHDISISTPYGLPLSESATIGEVLAAVNGFMNRRRFTTEPRPAFSLQGRIDEAARAALASFESCVDHDDSTLTIEDGAFFLRIDAHGDGHGIAPDGMPELIDALAPLLARGGVLELIDHDLSAANKDEAVAPYFIGRDDAERRGAQVEYGLDLAHDYVGAVIGKAGWDEVVALARARAAASA